MKLNYIYVVEELHNNYVSSTSIYQNIESAWTSIERHLHSVFQLVKPQDVIDCSVEPSTDNGFYFCQGRALVSHVDSMALHGSPINTIEYRIQTKLLER